MNRRRSKRSGSVFLDALMAFFVLSLGAAAFFSLMPIMDRTKNMSREQTVALQMCNRMIDQLQLLKPSQVTASYLSQLNLIDPSQSSSPYTFSHMPMDDATKYTPATALKNGTGTLTVTPVDSGSVMLNVEIDWKSADGKAQKIQTGTILGGYR